LVEKVKGKAWKFGDNVNTDLVYPGHLLKSFLPAPEMAKHAMEGADPRFAREVKPNDVVVGGRNFGCGSSREEAVTSLKAVGVGAVVAESFGRIFFRNAVNVGLPVLECKGVSSRVNSGDLLEVDVAEGEVRNLTTGGVLRTIPLPPFMLQILDKGGLIPYTKDRLAGKKA